MIYFRDAKGGLGERAAIAARANMPPGTLFFLVFIICMKLLITRYMI